MSSSLFVNYKLFKKAKYGLMIHFVYSLLCGYSKNSVGPRYVEWTQCKCMISVEELNRSWGYSCDDNNWKSSDDILQNRLKLEKLGINYLINIGPDWLGRIPYKSRIILEEVQKKYLEKCNSI